jgi:hypothetical protein
LLEVAVSVSSSTGQKKPVPPNIQFDDELLFVPSFEEVGIPACLGRLGTIKTTVNIGDWVNRGEPLVTARYSVFSSEKKRPWPFSDSTWSADETLSSPVSGLVLGFRTEETNVPSSWGTVYYDTESVLPILLVPRDEPPQDDWHLHYFQRIGSLLAEHWARMPFFHRDKGSTRLNELRPILEDERWEPAFAAIAKFTSPILKRFEIRRMNKNDAGTLGGAIQYMRAHDLSLRDKLVHLTKIA